MGSRTVPGLTLKMPVEISATSPKSGNEAQTQHKQPNVSDQTITSVSRESRVFRPSAEFQRQANLGSYAAYKRLYAESVNSPERFWDRQAKEHIVWRKPYKSVLKWDAPHAKWFTGGKLNVAEN